METNIHSKNNTRLLEKKKRHKAIHRLLNEGDIGTHDEIVSKLREEEIFTSQTTIHRDLEQLGIKKNIEGYFKPSHEIKQRFHLETLRELIVNSDSTTCSNVQTFFIKTEKGYSQQIALQLEQAFSDIVLRTIIDIDSVLVFADGEKVNNDFLELLGKNSG